MILRKIKIWDKEKKRMIENISIVYFDGKLQEACEVTEYNKEEGDWSGDEIAKYEIIYHTGEKDDNNQELWEKDIVENHLGNRFVIMQDKSQWILRDKYGGTNITLHTACSLGLKKIGNFYLDPELLRGSTQ